MSAKRIAGCVLAICAITHGVSAQLWTDVEVDPTERAMDERWIVPNAARIVELDMGAIEVAIASAPTVMAGASWVRGADVTLPYPDGTNRLFELVISSIMEPDLAADFPDIQTFILRGIDDPTAWGRGDLTPQGFHVMVWGSEGVFLVDPYASGNATLHQGYFARNHELPSHAAGRVCATDATDASEQGPLHRVVDAGPDPKLSQGDTLREYRIAIAATGEYTQFHGGTVSSAMAAVTTALNRVNAIYERDLAIRFNLVAGNADVIYTDPLTDPYTNDDPDALLIENHVNLNVTIGALGYDIGHVLSTADVGRARIGSMCDSEQKGKGETGRSTPVGDIYHVDVLAHEIGHQLNAQHTFNGSTGDCLALRNAPTAYEPGSGSTIMSIPIADCGVENLQPSADAYFHVASLGQITSFITAGAGSACGSTSNTGNTPPTANAGDDFTIPFGTPFVLSGNGFDPDGDSLSYTWEQLDLGDPSPPMTDDGFRPIFRSWPPSSERTRILPRLEELLSGTLAIGESLPTTDRSLTFRLTVRDNRTGGGGVDTDTAVLTVTTAAGPFAVTAPNTATTWNGVGPHTIAWNVAGTDVSPVNCSSVDIALSTDGGATFPIGLANGVANDGLDAEYVFVPDTTTARIRIDCSDNIFFDVSDVDFTIVDSGELIFQDDLESNSVREWAGAYP